MGSYSSDDEALIGLARQLVDAYNEARTGEDQDFACDSVAEFLAEFRESAPSEALLAFLGLPLTAETYPLVDETQMALAARGPAVVELLLEAVLGNVYDPDGPASERAADTIDALPPGEASQGLTEVLCGRGHDDLKGAAVDGLVALGGLAEPDLVVTLDDAQGGEWARAALEQIRFEREHPDAGDSEDEDDDLDAGDEDTDAGDEEFAEEPDGEVTSDDDADGELAGVGDELAEDALPEATDSDAARLSAAGDQAGPAAEPASGKVAGPDLELVDDAYQDFLRRFGQDSGDEPPAS
jgi:hypothetical protein